MGDLYVLVATNVFPLFPSPGLLTGDSGDPSLYSGGELGVS